VGIAMIIRIENEKVFGTIGNITIELKTKFFGNVSIEQVIEAYKAEFEYELNNFKEGK
jgi:hypothetical protein